MGDLISTIRIGSCLTVVGTQKDRFVVEKPTYNSLRDCWVGVIGKSISACQSQR